MNTLTSGQLDEKVWFEQAVAALANSGPTGQASAEYIRRHRIPLGFTSQRNSGASWFDWRKLRRGVFLRTTYANRQPDDPWPYALIAHEAKHLEQGIMGALSVRGELIAWQLQYDVLEESSTAPFPRHVWQELRALAPDVRADLKRARLLMKQIAGEGYRIDWLPLWPLLAEVAHRLKTLGQQPG